jgi:hypothetical protein
MVFKIIWLEEQNAEISVISARTDHAELPHKWLWKKDYETNWTNAYDLGREGIYKRESQMEKSSNLKDLFSSLLR